MALNATKVYGKERVYEPRDRIRVAYVSTGLTIPYDTSDVIEYLALWAREHLKPQEYVWQISFLDKEDCDATVLICDGGEGF